MSAGRRWRRPRRWCERRTARRPRFRPPSQAGCATWDTELELLLAELARQRDRGSTGGVVEMPGRLSVSQLVLLRGDPAELARSLRRPLPRKPAPLARAAPGSTCGWRRGGASSGCSTSTSCPAPPTRAPSRTPTWSPCSRPSRPASGPTRVPAEVELPFDLVVDGLLLRGRCDAVFTDAADGLVDVVDWKTGPPRTGADATAAAVQLAVYRLAWHHLTGEPLDRIRASFHHVAANVTVRPADLLDEPGLAA